MESQRISISIPPDPQILYVLTYAVMKPLDSLCELIDNSIDALQSSSTPGGLIIIELPTKKQIDEGTAIIRVRDNGPGMTVDEVQNALRAGYSSKKRYGSLGIFGVGFNIASGKLGRVTKFITARSQDDFAIEVELDLVALRKKGTFDLEAVKISKPQGLDQGTVVEISQPWGQDSQNFGFMQKLVGIGRSKILYGLGRIYATILREKKIRILVGEDAVEAYEHCIWSGSRFVERQKHGRIPAVYHFTNQAIYTHRRCQECEALVEGSGNTCPDPKCNSSSIVTIEEKISGWLGIQRYKDASHYGIDLIRNGRAIRTLEKSAFFEFQDPSTGEPIVDYPIDDREGRIVGEIHLNHVPVDPAKQDFERSSPEWKRAIEFLRGNTSLQPTKAGSENNQTTLYKLYQGYRKVREPGMHDMYMGKWVAGNNSSAVLLQRSEVEKLKEKFDKRETGFFDDSEWWKLVELADQKPVPGLKKCPQCNLDCQEETEECDNCGYVFEGKPCINNDCGKLLPRSAVICPHCGFNQVPDVRNPWACKVCNKTNPEEEEKCSNCGSPRGTPDPVSLEALLSKSQKSDALSIQAMTLALASGEPSSPLDITTYYTQSPIQAFNEAGNKIRLPSVRFVSTDLKFFLDPKHPMFATARAGVEQTIASEVAAYLFALHHSLVSRYPAQHSITKLTSDLLEKYWKNKYSPVSAATEELSGLFDLVKERLAGSIGDEGEELYNNLSQEGKSALVREITQQGRDPSEIKGMAEKGDFVLFLKPRAIVDVLRFNPTLFFDGNVWDLSYSNIPTLDPAGGLNLQAEIKAKYANRLETIALFLEHGQKDPAEAEMARAAAAWLREKLK